MDRRLRSLKFELKSLDGSLVWQPIFGNFRGARGSPAETKYIQYLSALRVCFSSKLPVFEKRTLTLLAAGMLVWKDAPVLCIRLQVHEIRIVDPFYSPNLVGPAGHGDDPVEFAVRSGRVLR